MYFEAAWIMRTIRHPKKTPKTIKVIPKNRPMNAVAWNEAKKVLATVARISLFINLGKAR